MKKTFYYMFILFFANLVFYGCSDSTEPKNQEPQKVRFVPKSADVDAVETGIDAVAVPGSPNQNSIFLQWYSTGDDDIESYQIFRRTGTSLSDSVGTFVKIAEVVQPFNSKDTSYIDESAGEDTLYFYYVIAKDEDGLTGKPSAKEFYRLLPAPTILSPVSGQNFSGQFEWLFSYIPQNFYFRLERRIGVSEFEVVGINLLDNIASVEPQQSRNLNEVGFSSLPSGFYQWRIEISNNIGISDKRAGCESTWGSFQVN
ncbi:MAG: hypothetical protein R3C26_22375 [Calditrichia bacterium]|nr:hypothetical protein [Calditrichota bacterium]MCB9066893.1 hypothetical protein [Calditrichia bacterium]